MKQIKVQQYGQIYPADTQTPISLYLDLVGDQPGILLESAEVDGRLGRYSLIAWDFKLLLYCYNGKLHYTNKDVRFTPVINCSGLNFQQSLRNIINKIKIIAPPDLNNLPPITRSILGFFGYGLAGLFETKLAPLLTSKQIQAILTLPGKQILFDHLYHRCFFLSLDSNFDAQSTNKCNSKPKSTPSIGKIKTYPEKDTYCKNVSQTRELINGGEAIQVVLSTRFQAPFYGDSFTLYRRLRQTNPSPYMFYLHFPELTLIGSSPELLVRCEEQVLEVRPIAGTRPRGQDAREDQKLSDELLQDPKEKAEHVMLVDLGRNDLGRIAIPGSVKLEKFMQVERFSHVMHLTSYIKAILKSNLDCLDVLQATFPAGTVSGAPKIRAMEIIAQMEQIERGPYAGAVGWLGLDKENINLDTGITIRSMWIQNNQILWQAGAGIVSDSDPLKEWEECQNKAKAIRQILTQQGDVDVFAHR